MTFEGWLIIALYISIWFALMEGGWIVPLLLVIFYAVYKFVCFHLEN